MIGGLFLMVVILAILKVIEKEKNGGRNQVKEKY